MTSSQHPQSAPEGIDLKDGGDRRELQLLCRNIAAARLQLHNARIRALSLGCKQAAADILRLSEDLGQIRHNIVNTKTGSGQ